MLKVYNWDEFYNKSMLCSEIICIGVGKNFEEISTFPKGKQILKRISKIADNDIKKQGKQIQILDKKIDIVSIDQIADKVYSDVMILITCAAYREILNQLSMYPCFDKIEICCLPHMIGIMLDDFAMEKEIPRNLRLSDQQLIPKKIHYCWFGRSPIPEKYKKWMDSWRQYCPDYEIMEWNEDNYDVTKNKYMLQAYENKKWAFVPDYARLDIIYNEGGIYLDTDVELIQNIDDLLFQEGFVGFESANYVNFGSGFGAVKGHQLIKQLRDSYEEYDFIDKDGNMNLTASPVLQTDFLRTKGLRPGGEYQIVDKLTIFPEKMFNGKGATKTVRLKPYTRSIHHYDGSWVSDYRRDRSKQFAEDMQQYKM